MNEKVKVLGWTSELNAMWSVLASTGFGAEESGSIQTTII